MDIEFRRWFTGVLHIRKMGISWAHPPLIWILQSNFLPGSYLDLSCLFKTPSALYLATRVIGFELLRACLSRTNKSGFTKAASSVEFGCCGGGLCIIPNIRNYACLRRIPVVSFCYLFHQGEGEKRKRRGGF